VFVRVFSLYTIENRADESWAATLERRNRESSVGEANLSIEWQASSTLTEASVRAQCARLMSEAQIWLSSRQRSNEQFSRTVGLSSPASVDASVCSRQRRPSDHSAALSPSVSCFATYSLFSYSRNHQSCLQQDTDARVMCLCVLETDSVLCYALDPTNYTTVNKHTQMPARSLRWSQSRVVSYTLFSVIVFQWTSDYSRLRLFCLRIDGLFLQ